MFDNDEFSLAPINFFQISIDCYQIEGIFPRFPKRKADKYCLPDMSSLCGEDAFATVFMGWNKQGIEIFVVSEESVEECYYPDISRGDSVEIFIDTRDVKTSGYNTRFCHHFFFLPEAVDGHQMGEITRFRTEDVHELCDPLELKVKATTTTKGYSLNIFIPSSCLHGYDPEQFKRMGFTYRINRHRGASQHFSAITEEYQIEQQPALWSSVTLIPEPG